MMDLRTMLPSQAKRELEQAITAKLRAHSYYGFNWHGSLKTFLRLDIMREIQQENDYMKCSEYGRYFDAVWPYVLEFEESEKWVEK